jgi:hypothetical protein
MGAIAGAGDDHHLRVVGQTIQASRGQERIAEQLGPFLEGTVAGQQDAALLIPAIDDVLEVLGRQINRPP